MEQRYQLRKAAGSYWLLDMQQTGRTGKKPVSMNESGAMVWQRLCEGADVNTIAKEFQESYGISEQEIQADIGLFIDQLKEQGVEDIWIS